MNRRAFRAALTGSAVAVPAVAYGWQCVSVDRAAKVVTFEFVADCPYEDSIEYSLLNGTGLEYGKRAVGILG
jgi:hypothetical protein